MFEYGKSLSQGTGSMSLTLSLTFVVSYLAIYMG